MNLKETDTNKEYENTIDDKYNLLDDIESIEKELERFEKIVRRLWMSTLVPYINHPDSKILQRLTENDYHKFLHFMVNNSPVHKKLVYELNLLNKYRKSFNI